MEYASNAKGNLGVALGAIGTGLSALSGTGILSGLAGGSSDYARKEFFDVQLDLIDAKKSNAILAADLNTETKIAEAFKASVDRENKIRDELKAQILAVDQKVDSNAAAQAVINAQFGNQIGLNTSKIAQLFEMTKLVIPSTSVCYGTMNGTTTA